MASGSSLWSYVAGQCTWWVADNLPWIPAGLGNAKDWLTNAANDGLATGTNPQPGAVVVWGGNAYPPYGHVGMVTGVNADGTINVSEMNFSYGPNRSDTRDHVSTANVAGYIYPPASYHGGPLGTNVPAGSNSGQIGAGQLFSAPLLGSMSKDAAWRAGLILAGFVLVIVGLLVTFKSGMIVAAAPEASLLQKVDRPARPARPSAGAATGTDTLERTPWPVTDPGHDLLSKPSTGRRIKKSAGMEKNKSA